VKPVEFPGIFWIFGILYFYSCPDAEHISSAYMYAFASNFDTAFAGNNNMRAKIIWKPVISTVPIADKITSGTAP
jgi:hypothetical protein